MVVQKRRDKATDEQIGSGDVSPARPQADDGLTERERATRQDRLTERRGSTAG